MTAINRSAARAELASLLNTALVGSGKPAQAVYGYEVGDLGGQSPVVMVTSGFSRRKNINYTPRYDNGFKYVIQNWVRQADADVGWSEEDTENALDDLEQGVAQVVSDNIGHMPYWWSLEYMDDTEILKVRDLGGTPYLVELIPVICRVEDSA